MVDFRFTNDFSPTGAAQVIDVLRRPRLWVPTHKNYPKYDAWLEKTEAQLLVGKKRAMVASLGSVPIGAIVYQRHEDRPNILEVRNISVTPESNGRYVGSFALRNAEIEGAIDFSGIDTVMVDTKVTNTDMIEFLLHHGYGITEVTDLYGQNAGLDVVLTKQVGAPAQSV